MDVFAGDAAAASTLSASLDAKSLFTLGRPLWSAMMQAKGRFDDVLGLARSKLLGGREPGDGGNEIGSLALLSYRINFYVVLHSLAEELVSGYLRYIVDMSDNRTFLRTLQPSEPILAHLSAREMHAHRDKRRDVIRTLYENTVKGTIHLGDIGEIVAALILLFAFDKSHTEQLPTPVRFSNFLASLFSNDKSLAIEQCMRDDEQMRRLWTDGYVFFNHFVRIAEKPTDETLRRAYQRGAAIFPPFGYKGCGIVIPVALPAENTMTYFIVQVKNRRDDSLTPGLRNEARDALKSAAMLLPSSSSAHVALLVSLRSKSGQGDMDIAYPAKRSTETGEVPPPRASQKNKKKKKKSSQIAGGSSGGGGAQPSTTPEYIWKDGELKRVVIVAVGMDLDLYPGLGFGSEPKEEPETVEIVGYLKSLLNCTSEMPTATQDSYYDHLATLG